MVWSGAMRPARSVTATSVPMLSKRSTKRKTKMISKSADVERARGCRGGRRWPDGGEIVGGGLPVDLMAEDAEERGGEDADQHGCADAEDLQDGDEEEAEDGEGGRRGVEVAEGDGGGGAGDDDAGVAESDEGDEEADASADRGVELMRDGGDEALADAGEGEQRGR